MKRTVLLGTVVKPIRNWCRVIFKPGDKVAVLHWREDLQTCTVKHRNEKDKRCWTGVSIDHIELDLTKTDHKVK